MSQIEFVVDQLKCAFDGEAWHGPALMEILDGIDAATAAAHPIPEAHSVWELLLHVAAWEQVVTRRILEGKELTLTDDQNFRHIVQFDEAAGKDAIRALTTAHAELIEAVAALPKSRLSERVPGKPYDILFMVLGTAQHAAYHGGQIALLKKCLG